MNEKVLLAYASTHGSTQEIAEAVARVLREKGLHVDVQPARDVRGLEGYNAVVLGGPIYMFRWHQDVLRFLSKNRKILSAGLPIAVFAGGPIEMGGENELSEVRKQLDKELAKFPWLSPAAVLIVGGRFDPTHLRFPWNLIPALKQMPAKDLRDWDAVRDWAGSLVEQFRLVLA